MLRLFTVCLLAAAFDTASVRPSKVTEGHDGTVTLDPLRFSAKNTTLKQLIHEAWQVPYSRILTGPAWIEAAEFDIEARTEAPHSPSQMRLMLQTLLAERFRVRVHPESRTGRVYFLVTAESGPNLNTRRDDASWRFHGSLEEFADRLSIALAIPILNDPTVPSHPAGAGVPIVNKTGLAGAYDIAVDFKPEPGADIFTLWQRVLQEQLGLRLESHTAPVEMLVIDHAERPPIDGN